MASALERYYDGFGNVVLRDEDGNPSVFVRHPKQLSSEFDPSLPEHVHPAFTCGTDGSGNLIVDDAVLIGKYYSSQLTTGGRHYSLPNAVPANDESYNDQIANARWLAGSVYTTEMTIADYGLMVLMAHQKGIDRYAHGNTMLGVDYAYGNQLYDVGEQVAVGTVRYFAGYEFTCIKAHTTSVDLLPLDAPGYWKRGRKIGGTPMFEMMDKVHTSINDVWHDKYFRSRITLTGSGPKSWYAYGDPTQEADICGPLRVRICDLRINYGEVQIIPNNAAGDGGVNPTDGSLFRAILPHSNDNGFDFVTPGTEGTVHYDTTSGGAVILKAGASTGTSEKGVAFNQIQVDTNSLPYVPYILYELGLAPIPGTHLNHNFALSPANSGKRPTFNCRFMEFTDPGHLRLDFNVDPVGGISVGARMRARELASS